MNIQTILIEFANRTFDSKVVDVQSLPRSGSYRRYFRLKLEGGQSVIGVYNSNRDENIVFIYMTKHFLDKGFRVPRLYGYDIDRGVYLLQDLGDLLLSGYVSGHLTELKEIYERILDDLYLFQTVGIEDFDWRYTYPVSRFDKSAYFFDLNYFKYNVLKFEKIEFNELKLHYDFEKLVNFILSADHRYFCYRDFQSRNIMVYDGNFYYIDYQGGRRGNLFYDLASLLYDSHSWWFRERPRLRKYLVSYYYRKTRGLHNLGELEFYIYFIGNAVVRKLQALAAHYLRGVVEKKLFFLPTIPGNIEELYNLLLLLPFNLEELRKSIESLYEGVSSRLGKYLDLEVEVNSFGYQSGGYPEDASGNGGGFVFDCRLLPNPYYVSSLRDKDGLDEAVQRYLDGQPLFEVFIGRVIDVVSMALEEYVRKGYSRLQVNFGCTGGVHRSVYCAEKFVYYLRKLYRLRRIVVNHRRLGVKNVYDF